MPGMMMKVCFKNKSIKLANSGAAWGVIYFELADGVYYPSAAWDDLVVAVVVEWGDSIGRISSGGSFRETFKFMDSPNSVAVFRDHGEFFATVSKSTFSGKTDQLFCVNLSLLVKSHIERVRSVVQAVNKMGVPAAEMRSLAALLAIIGVLDDRS